MMFFKKKKSIGQGRNEVIFLHKDMEALNYTPIDYMYTTKYSNFLKNREKVFEKLIDSTCPDDLCENMLDCYIDAITEEMKACSKEQYTHHIHFISHYKGIIDGQLAQGHYRLGHLQQDLSCIEEKIQKLQSLQKTIESLPPKKGELL